MKRLEKRWKRGTYDPWTDPDPDRLHLEEAFERFLDGLRQKGRADSTIEMYSGILRRWKKRLPPGLMADQIKPKHIRPFVHDDSVKYGTRDKRYRHLKAFLNTCVDQGVLPENPLKQIDRPRTETNVRPILTPDDVERLFDYIDRYAASRENEPGKTPEVQWLKDAIQLVIGTGLRRGELVNLKWNDVDLSNRRLRVKHRQDFKTKGRSERVIPVRGSALQVLQRRDEEFDPDPGDPVMVDQDGDPIRPNRYTRQFKRMVRGAELEDAEELRFHDLRHSTGYHLASQNVSREIIQEILGHSTRRTTAMYTQIGDPAKEKAMEAAFGDSD